MDSVRARRRLPASHPAVRWASLHPVPPTRPRHRPRTHPISRAPRPPRRSRLPARHRGPARRRRRRRRRLPRPADRPPRRVRRRRRVLRRLGVPHHPSDPRRDGRRPGASTWRRSGVAAPGVCWRPPPSWSSPSRLGTHVVLPPLTQRSVVTDVVAAATFSSNFVFAQRLGSYFGAQLGQSTPSPLLHFWSLAVEEQFYLCWPPLLVALTQTAAAVPPAAAADDRTRRRARVRAGRVADAAGAVVGVLPPADADGRAAGRRAARRRRHAAHPHPGRGARPRSAWVGLAVIVVACVRFDEAMPWPGTAVLVPVLATMAVIVGGPAVPVLKAARAAVDRPALVRAVPVALAGARARRCPMGSAQLDPALRGGGDRRRPVGPVVPARRGSGAPQLAGWPPSPPAASPSVRRWCWSC